MEGTKNFCKFLEDISKEVRLYKTTAVQSIYLYLSIQVTSDNFC